MTAVLLTSDVAALFGVNVKTVSRWAKSGRLPVLRKVPGVRGPLIFDAAVVERLHSP